MKISIRNLLADKKRIIVAITWLVIAVTSLPFERINDDEVIYYETARHIATVGPTYLAGLVTVPEILGALVIKIYPSIIAVRTISAVFVLATALLIYYIGRNDGSFIASMLYLTSFYTIRFGLRFYEDPYGGLFVIAAIYFLYKQKGRLVGASSALAAFSRQLAAPLVLVFAVLAYRKRDLKKFVVGLTMVVVLELLWLYLSSATINQAIVAGALEVRTPPFVLLISIAKSWVQYALISPLVVLGLVFARGGKGREEFYPMVLSFLVLNFVPGFWTNGAATEYPYIFNTIACLVAGFGLKSAYVRYKPNSKSIVKVVVAVFLVQFAAQSYFATALNVNHVVGVQDYGYWYDQQLLSYLNRHYQSGEIYASTLDPELNQTLAQNLVWIPQNVTLALVNNPPWLVTFSSYVIIGSVPPNATVSTFGPYVVIHIQKGSLSSFVESSNSTQFFR